MESSSSNSKERELQQMQMEEREPHQKCLAWFTKLKTHLEFLHNINSPSVGRNGPYEIAFQIFFHEVHETFRMKMYHNLNQLQWQLERENLHLSNPKSCLDILRTPEVQAIKDIEKRLNEKEIQLQESLVTEDTALEANLSTNSSTLEASSVIEGAAKENNWMKAAVQGMIDTVSEVNHDMFENVFGYGTQNHEQPEYIPDTYVVNKNNSDIKSDIPNMDPNRDKEEHDYTDHEQQRAFFASLINNLKCDVEKCNKVNREAHQANALLKNELERYKEKEKYFTKDKTIEYEYCKKIKLLNDEISNLKSQACQ
ncbi:hypothetical protein Tco_0317202 [Tanacetum coccineum]